MCRNLSAPLPLLVTLLLLVGSLPAGAVCTAGNPNTSVIESSPTSDFVAFGTTDIAVIHNKTGLTWKRCAEGQAWNGSTCTGTALTMSWANALNAANTANIAAFAGYTDWRLPNVRELMSIVDYSKDPGPTINAAYFPGTRSNTYWASTTYGQNATLAWRVTFNDGGVNVDLKSINSYVRCVRGGQ